MKLKEFLNEKLISEESSDILVSPSRAELRKHAIISYSDSIKARPQRAVYRFIAKEGGDFYVGLAFHYTHDDLQKRAGVTSKDEFDVGLIAYDFKNKEYTISSNELLDDKKTTHKKLSRFIGNFDDVKIDFVEESVNEELAYVKFKYSNYKEDPRPRVKVLDFRYPGQPNQKNYGKRDDLLGWNLNYYSNKKEAKAAIDDIADFASLLAANKLEMYRRIKAFFPEQAKLIRRYNREHIKGEKEKRGILWRRADLNALEKRNQELF